MQRTEDAAPPEPDPSILPEAVGVSMMITRRQRAALAALGVSDEDIRAMTPAEAHARLGLAAQG